MPTDDREGTGKFQNGEVDKKLLQLSGQMQTTVLDNQSCGPELSLCTTKV